MRSLTVPDRPRPSSTFVRSAALALGLVALLSGCLGVKVSSNGLLNGDGKPARLLGVNRMGTEYACIQGWGLFDGPSDAASVNAIKAWHTNTVRVPLNEDCWLAINGAPAAYSGDAYRTAITNYVSVLNAAGMIAILDLHWNAPGTQLSTGQQLMADADHAPAFWTSVATTFKSNSAVVFDLYNEPHDISWACWRDGCTTSQGWKSAGMQALVDAVRATGAKQPLLLGGLAWANDLSQWLTFEPTDPAGQLIAGFHLYNFTTCATATCWDSTIAPVAAHVPVLTGELGENDCGHGFIDTYMAWADTHNISYLGWTWTVADCSGTPSLITDYTGTPTAFGIGLRDHLAAIGGI